MVCWKGCSRIRLHSVIPAAPALCKNLVGCGAGGSSRSASLISAVAYEAGTYVRISFGNLDNSAASGSLNPNPLVHFVVRGVVPDEDDVGVLARRSISMVARQFYVVMVRIFGLHLNTFDVAGFEADAKILRDAGHLFMLY